jgi:hypothetical protein
MDTLMGGIALGALLLVVRQAAQAACFFSRQQGRGTWARR